MGEGGVYCDVNSSVYQFPSKIEISQLFSLFEKIIPKIGEGIYRIGNQKIQHFALNWGGVFVMNFTEY